jgi:hypothetical protein
MPRFGIPNRESGGRIGQIAQVNWRRGLFRVWLLLSAAWFMGWTVYIVVNGIKDGFQSFGDLFAIPVFVDWTACRALSVWGGGAMGLSWFRARLAVSKLDGHEWSAAIGAVQRSQGVTG